MAEIPQDPAADSRSATIGSTFRNGSLTAIGGDAIVDRARVRIHAR